MSDIYSIIEKLENHPTKLNTSKSSIITRPVEVNFIILQEKLETYSIVICTRTEIYFGLFVTPHPQTLQRFRDNPKTFLS